MQKQANLITILHNSHQMSVQYLITLIIRRTVCYLTPGNILSDAKMLMHISTRW
jgi:hypothetical protein